MALPTPVIPIGLVRRHWWMNGWPSYPRWGKERTGDPAAGGVCGTVQLAYWRVGRSCANQRRIKRK